jgi:UDP-N-acetylmuramoylalanine--D-glutamate ligase
MVAEADGIRWIDDSKATNPHAANASLASFDRVVWIVGGLLKGVDISSLIERHKTSLTAAVVIGADRSAVLEALAEKAPGVPVIEINEQSGSEVMVAAVKAAKGFAVSGDVVLLAPAAASMDQFKDYADRGHSFAAAVTAQIGGDRG